MKITTDGLVAGNQVQNANQREKTSQRFEDILKNIADNETATTEKVSPSQPPFQVAPVFLDPVKNDDVLQKLDGSLALLESYQSRLSDPTVPVHELQPDIDKLENEANQLQSKLLALPDDHPVKDLLNRSIVTMTVEIAKYHRGDFN
jgi:hypothetical protein